MCFQGTSDNESKEPEDEAGGDEEGRSKKDLPRGQEVESQENEEKNGNKKGTAEEQQQQEEVAKRKK